MKKLGKRARELKQQSKPNLAHRAMERELSQAQDNLARAQFQQQRDPSDVAIAARVSGWQIQVDNLRAALRDYAKMQKSRVFYLAIGCDHHADDELVLCRTYAQAAIWCEGFRVRCTTEHRLRPDDWKEADLNPGYEDDWQLRIQHDLGYSVAVRRLVAEDPVT